MWKVEIQKQENCGRLDPDLHLEFWLDRAILHRTGLKNKDLLTLLCYFCLFSIIYP